MRGRQHEAANPIRGCLIFSYWPQEERRKEEKRKGEERKQGGSKRGCDIRAKGINLISLGDWHKLAAFWLGDLECMCTNTHLHECMWGEFQQNAPEEAFACWTCVFTSVTMLYHIKNIILQCAIYNIFWLYLWYYTNRSVTKLLKVSDGFHLISKTTIIIPDDIHLCTSSIYKRNYSSHARACCQSVPLTIPFATEGSHPHIVWHWLYAFYNRKCHRGTFTTLS